MYTVKDLKKFKLDKSYWGERIIAAAEVGEFTLDMRKYACSWDTCACGMLTQNIERVGYDTSNPLIADRPVDIPLRDLGYDFTIAVDRHDFNYAADALIKIYQRADELVEAQNESR